MYETLSRDAYFAIADECKNQNFQFAGHIPYTITFKEAADAGQRSIEHLTGLGPFFYCGCPPQQAIEALPGAIANGSPFVPLMKQAIELCDEQQAFALFQYLARKQVWQCPTLVARRAIHPFDENVLSDDRRMKNRFHFLKDKDGESGPVHASKPVPRNKKIKEKIFLEKAMPVISQMKKAGIQFLAGVDVRNHYLYPGFSLHEELALLVEAGLTPMEALQAATINPAKFLGTTDPSATIEKRKNC